MTKNTIRVVQVEYGIKNRVPFIGIDPPLSEKPGSTKYLTLAQLSCILTETTDADGDGIFNLYDAPCDCTFKHGEEGKIFTVPSYLDAKYEKSLNVLIQEIRAWVSQLHWTKSLTFTIPRKEEQ